MLVWLVVSLIVAGCCTGKLVPESGIYNTVLGTQLGYYSASLDRPTHCKLQRHFTNILIVQRHDSRVFHCQSCCSDCVFYSVKGMSACFTTRAAQEQLGKWLEKELQVAGFADCVSLFCQTVNDLQAVLLGMVVEKIICLS